MCLAVGGFYSAGRQERLTAQDLGFPTRGKSGTKPAVVLSVRNHTDGPQFQDIYLGHSLVRSLYPNYPLGCELRSFPVSPSPSLLFSALTLSLSHSPRSMRGGDLHWIWTGYEIYQEVDWVSRRSAPPGQIADSPPQVYGVKALQENDGFPSAQGPYPADRPTWVKVIIDFPQRSSTSWSSSSTLFTCILPMSLIPLSLHFSVLQHTS